MTIWNCIKRRDDKLIEYNIGHSELLIRISEGQVEGKNCVGRPKSEFVKQIVDDMGCRSYEEMKKLSFNREKNGNFHQINLQTDDSIIKNHLKSSPPSFI